jgi:isochorismate synthase EntC
MHLFFLFFKKSITLLFKLIYMKKLYFFPAVLVGILIGFQSCSKQSPNDIVASPANLINATIAANQTYLLTLDNSASVSVSKQASHFQVSQIEMDTKNAAMIYKYVPAINYTGTDEVVLANTKAITTQSNSNGCNSNQNSNSNNITYATSYTTVRINITK